MTAQTDLGWNVRRRQERLSRAELRLWQLNRLNELALQTIRQCPYWQHRLAHVTFPLSSLDQLETLPQMTKGELMTAVGASGMGLLTAPISDYTRVHRTSGTSNRPLLVFDTPSDWEWWIETWQFVLDAAEIEAGDRAVMAFSYGPYIGFWSAHDALLRRGAMVFPTGGMSTEARLQSLRDVQATVVCCTPTYALRMLEVAEHIRFDLRSLPVRVLIVAGEPGGSVIPIRSAIEQGWDAVVMDHAGATELGPWGYADRHRRGLHVIESEFIAELLPPSATMSADSSLQELVLTPLGRHGMPLFRYRTGDLVHASYPQSDADENQFVFLDGGIVGRADDMLVIRGVNVFPSTIESAIRGVRPLAEYRIIVDHTGPLNQLCLQVEADTASCDAIAHQLATLLGLRVRVASVSAGSLERFDGKSRRTIRTYSAK